MMIDITNPVAILKSETTEYTDGYEAPKTDYFNENVCDL